MISSHFLNQNALPLRTTTTIAEGEQFTPNWPMSSISLMQNLHTRRYSQHFHCSSSPVHWLQHLQSKDSKATKTQEIIIFKSNRYAAGQKVPEEFKTKSLPRDSQIIFNSIDDAVKSLKNLRQNPSRDSDSIQQQWWCTHNNQAIFLKGWMMYPIVQQIGFFFFFITTLGSSALQTWQPGACLLAWGSGRPCVSTILRR